MKRVHSTTLAAWLCLASIAATNADIEPSNFPSGCGALTVLSDSDTCSSLTELTGRSVEQLRALNDGNLDCASLSAGDTLCIADELSMCAHTRSVAAGDSCADVAADYGLSAEALLTANQQLAGADCSDLPAGEVCVVAPGDQGCGGLTYDASAGESLRDVASQFALTPSQLKALNPGAFDSDGKAKSASTLCIGCPPLPINGVPISRKMSALLNTDQGLCHLLVSDRAANWLDGDTLVFKAADGQGEIHLTPEVFEDGRGLAHYVNVTPALLTIDLSHGITVRLADLTLRILGRKRSRKLLDGTWVPKSYGPNYYAPHRPYMYY